MHCLRAVAGALAAAHEQVIGIERPARVAPGHVDRDRQARGDCTSLGAASASAPNTAGPRYQPVRVRAATAAGRAQFRIDPSGARTVNGR